MAKQDARSILPRRLRANLRTVARGLRALKAERTRAQAAGRDFVFSVIVPVYNTAAYLEDCVQSVIAQSVGFSDIQLILVDDGSTDDSATICERSGPGSSATLAHSPPDSGSANTVLPDTTYTLSPSHAAAPIMTGLGRSGSGSTPAPARMYASE